MLTAETGASPVLATVTIPEMLLLATAVVDSGATAVTAISGNASSMLPSAVVGASMVVEKVPQLLEMESVMLASS